MSWFYGFKLHLVVNDCGELLSVRGTSGNTDDRQPVPELAAGLTGRLFGEKGYISQALWEQLMEQHLQLNSPSKKHEESPDGVGKQVVVEKTFTG